MGYLKEAKKNEYQLYHPSYSGAIAEVRRYAEKNGYTLDDDEMFDKIGMGPRKPGPGKTNKFSLSLYKKGKPQKKMLHFQVYNRGYDVGNNFELNAYFS